MGLEADDGRPEASPPLRRGGRFRTSGAGIRTKAGVTRAYEAKLANLAS